MLAEQLGKEFVDADTALVETFGKSIPDIFAEEGEAGFREKETAVLAELGKKSGLVIATGGGCVTKDRNYPLLHQNGTVFWLQRDLDVLPTVGRPLSQAGRLESMYQIRKPLYEAFCDCAVDNNRGPEETVRQILAQLEGNL